MTTPAKLETISMPPGVVAQILSLAPVVHDSLRRTRPGDKETYFIAMPPGASLPFVYEYEHGYKSYIKIRTRVSDHEDKATAAMCFAKRGMMEIYPLARYVGTIGIAKCMCHEIAHMLDERLFEDREQYEDLMRQMDELPVGNSSRPTKAYHFMPCEVRAEATSIVEIILPYLAKEKPGKLLEWTQGGLAPRELKRTYLRSWAGTEIEAGLKNIALRLLGQLV